MPARFTFTAILIASLTHTAAVGAQEAPRNKLSQVLYPVADLVVPVEMDYTQPQKRPAIPLEVRLMELVRDTCEPNNWAFVGGRGTIEYMPKDMKLVVVQTASCHERIRHLLAELRKLQDIEIAVETRYLTLSPARAKTLDNIGGNAKFGRFLPADGPDAVCLTDREVRLLLAFGQEDRNCSVMAAPKITMFNGQKAALSIADSVGVQDGDIDQDGKAITSKMVEVGIRNILQPVHEPAHGSVRLAVECRHTTQSKSNGRGRVFVTQLIKHVVRVPQDQTAIMKLGVGDTGRPCYVLLTPRLVRQSEESATKAAKDEPAALSRRHPSELSLRVFSVADLLTPIVAKSDVQGSKQGTARQMTAQGLIDLVTAAVAKSTWRGQGGDGAIQFYPLGQGLVVLQRDEVQQEVDQLLTAVRRMYDLRVSFDCRIVELSEAAAERIAQGKSRLQVSVVMPPSVAAPGTLRHAPKEARRPTPSAAVSEEQDRTGPIETAPARPAAAATAKSTVPLLSKWVLSATEAGELRRLLAAESAVVERALGAVTFNGCSVQIDRTKPYTFTTDVKASLEDDRVVVKPVTRTVRLGMSIEALPIVKADGSGLTLEISVEHKSLAGAAPTRTVRIGADGEESVYVLQVPALNVSKMETTLVLDKDATLILPLGATLTETRTEYGTPVLSQIPYVNRLFRTVGYGREARQLYVVITPQVHGR